MLLSINLGTNCLRSTATGRGIHLQHPYHGYVKNLILAATGKLDAHFTTLWEGGHIKFFSRRTLTKLLELAGFRYESFQVAGRFPGLWKSMLLQVQKSNEFY